MLRRVFLSILLLLTAGLLAAGWYASTKGFTQKWRRFVVREFHKRGVELALSKLTLEPFRGIVAKQVRLYDHRDRKRAVAVVDEVRLVINFANFFQGKPFIDALDLHDANLDVPLDPAKPGGTKVAIRHLSGRLFLPPRQIHLSRLEAELYGIRVRASGQLINPRNFSFFSKKSGGAAELAERVIAEIRKLKFEGAPPQLEVRFSGDLDQPEQLFVEATLWAEKVRRDNCLLENFYVNGGFRDGIARLRQLTANDAGGVLRASGSYDAATREAALQLHSGLDVQKLAQSFARIAELEECVFYAPPALDLTARATFGASLSFHAIGHVRLEKFACKSVIFESFDADLSADGKRWAALDVRLAHRTGEIAGDVLQLEEEFRSGLKSTIRRKVLAPVLTGKIGEWFREVEFAESAKVGARVSQTVAAAHLH